jgi:hypothetical protein
MFISCYQNAGQNDNMKIANMSFTHMTEFKQLGKTNSGASQILGMFVTVQFRILSLTLVCRINFICCFVCI